MKRLVITCLLCAACALAFGEDIKWSSWVKLKETGTKSYEVREGIPAGYVVHLVPRTPGSDSPKKILVLFPKKSSAYDTALEQILLTFQSRSINAVVTLYYYKKDNVMGDAALKLAERENYSLIFSMGSDSTDFVYSRYRGGKIPVVTICSKDPVLRGQVADYESGSGTNIAYTSLDMPVKIQLDYLTQLVGDLKNVVVLYARQNKSAYDTQVVPLLKTCAGTSITVIPLVVENAVNAKAELAEKVRAAREMLERVDPGLRHSVFWITGSTEVFSEIATIVKYSGSVPVLSAVPDVVLSGHDSAVLSIGVSFESNAQLAAFYGVRILKGEIEAGKLPVGIVSPPDIALNFLKAREIGLKIPFRFFERASIIYDYQGNRTR